MFQIPVCSLSSNLSISPNARLPFFLNTSPPKTISLKITRTSKASCSLGSLLSWEKSCLSSWCHGRDPHKYHKSQLCFREFRMFSIISAQQSFIISLNLNFNEEKVYWFKTNKKNILAFFLQSLSPSLMLKRNPQLWDMSYQRAT